jgi:hypothetical protein
MMRLMRHKIPAPYLGGVWAAAGGIDSVVRWVRTTPFGGCRLGHRNTAFSLLPLTSCNHSVSYFIHQWKVNIVTINIPKNFIFTKFYELWQFISSCFKNLQCHGTAYKYHEMIFIVWLFFLRKKLGYITDKRKFIYRTSNELSYLISTSKRTQGNYISNNRYRLHMNQFHGSNFKTTLDSFSKKKLFSIAWQPVC